MLLIFTDGDLYPREGWSFGKIINSFIVFGMTDVKQRICLISTARHDPDFVTNKVPEQILSIEDRVQLMTYRALKVIHILIF